MREKTWNDDGHVITLHKDDGVGVECTRPDDCNTKAGCDHCRGRGFLIVDDGDDDTCPPCKSTGLQDPVECWFLDEGALLEVLREDLDAWPPPGRYILEHQLIGRGEDAEFHARFGPCISLASPEEGERAS